MRRNLSGRGMSKNDKSIHMKKYMMIAWAALYLTGCGAQPDPVAAVAEKDHAAEEPVHDIAEQAEADHDHAAEAAEEHPDEIVFTRQQAEAAGLEVQTVAPAPFSGVIRTGGRIQPSQGSETTLAATADGIVTFADPSLSPGMAVRAGETLATVSARRIQNGDPATKIRNEYVAAEKDYRRAEELAKDRIVSAKELEEARLRYENARTAYEAQAADVTSEGVAVKAAGNGYVRNILVGQGEYVTVGQPLLTLAGNRRLQLQADVSENYYGALGRIRGANFIPSYTDRTYKLADLNGRLLSFGKSSDGEGFYIPVTFEFDNPGDIVPGAFAEIFLLSAPQEGVIAVPRSALTEEQGLYFVYLQLGDEVFKKQEVSLGADDGERVSVVSGLKPGDKVVVRGVYQVKLAANASVVPEGHSHTH